MVDQLRSPANLRARVRARLSPPGCRSTRSTRTECSETFFPEMVGARRGTSKDLNEAMERAPGIPDVLTGSSEIRPLMDVSNLDQIK